MKHLGRSGEHPFTGIQSRPARILDFLDFTAAFANNGPHPRIGDHELDGDRTTTRDGRLVEWLIIYSSHDETECLYAREIDVYRLKHMTCLRYGVQWTADVQNTLRIAWNALRHHYARPAFLPDLVYVRTAFPDDDGSVLGNDETAHVDVRGGRRRVGGRAAGSTRGGRRRSVGTAFPSSGRVCTVGVPWLLRRGWGGRGGVVNGGRSLHGYVASNGCSRQVRLRCSGFIRGSASVRPFVLRLVSV